MYCVRAEVEGAVGEASGVAVNSKVGRGVSVGGSGVNVATRVGGSLAIPAGWKGVGVSDESGAGVTSTSDGGAPRAVGKEQAMRDKQRSMKGKREFFMKYYSVVMNPSLIEQFPAAQQHPVREFVSPDSS